MCSYAIAISTVIATASQQRDEAKAWAAEIVSRDSVIVSGIAEMAMVLGTESLLDRLIDAVSLVTAVIIRLAVSVGGIGRTVLHEEGMGTLPRLGKSLASATTAVIMGPICELAPLSML